MTYLHGIFTRHFLHAAFFTCGIFYTTLLRKFLDISGHEPTPRVRNEPMQNTLQMGGGGFDPELIIYN